MNSKPKRIKVLTNFIIADRWKALTLKLNRFQHSSHINFACYNAMALNLSIMNLIFRLNTTVSLMNSLFLQFYHKIKKSYFINLLNDEFPKLAPGAVTNHKYYKKDGIFIEWGAPINANGILTHYLVEWTIANQTHVKKIPYQSEKMKETFKVSE